MPATYITNPPSTHAELYESNGLVGVELLLGNPPQVRLPAATAVIAAVFTPTATTGTIGGSDEVFQGIGLTYRAAKVIGGNGIDVTKPFHVRAWARRKPGTTGAIGANLIQLKCGSPLVELGRIEVLAAAAGTAEPVSNFVEINHVTGDARWTLANDETVSFAITTVDPDLEIVFEAVGETL